VVILDRVVALLLDGITVTYGKGPVVHALTLRVEQGESVALLGPSGSGKTTVLRAVAGLEETESGDVMFDNRRMNDVPPAERNLAMVFQQNVLFPNMDVGRNVGFPLSVRRLPASEIASRVEAETRATGIANLLKRNPRQLSAGQQQVVQLARAMVRRPGLLLVDEPFARLDHVGSERLRSELRLVQTGYGVTSLYATHDFADAMALADRVAVIDDGRIRQVGSSGELYSRPADTFVATFVGEPAMALLEARRTSSGLALGDLRLRVSERLPARVFLGVRPEDWIVGDTGVRAEVTRSYSLGADAYAIAQVSGTSFTIRSRSKPLREGLVSLQPRKFHVFDFSSGRAIHHSDD
jgi:ABC-type sugar transport system ATPase subunit